MEIVAVGFVLMGRRRNVRDRNYNLISVLGNPVKDFSPLSRFKVSNALSHMTFNHFQIRIIRALLNVLSDAFCWMVWRRGLILNAAASQQTICARDGH